MTSRRKPIALMDDGKGCVFVRGLEEEIVSTADEIYKILEKGSAKRRTAETLLNKQSSRSHSIFSITIHIKECTPEGEEMIKCGKLNLVDLAGSENISRSGAREGRAREAGEINKSLLTLGRVINALVDHSGHVPYRDSKLTRLLRDSLGGKTKTCIIATVSPSIHCLEETLSTLDYAHRAKNIKNKPEVNQKMMKSTMIKDLYNEIDRLKQELCAAREKNGIYIPQDRYLQEEAQKKAMTEKIERMELDSESKDKQLMELQELSNSQQLYTTELSDKLEKTQGELEETRSSLLDLEEKYGQAQTTIKEKEFLIFNLLKSEKALVEQTFALRSELHNAASDVSGLFEKIERKDKMEDGNITLLQKFHSQLNQQLELLHKTVEASVTHQEQQLKGMEADMQSFVSTKTDAMEEIRGKVENLKTMCCSGLDALDGLAGEINDNYKSTFTNLSLEVAKNSSFIEDLLQNMVLEASAVLDELQNSLCNERDHLAAYSRRQQEAHSRAVENTRCISRVAVNFFQSLDMHASKVNNIVEETQSTQVKKLSELEKKFEECVAAEERQILEKMAELLASSSMRKKKLVQAAVSNLHEGAVSRTNELQKEISTMQDLTDSMKYEWAAHMEKTETHYREDMTAVEDGKNGMEEGLKNCTGKVETGRQQWKTAQESLITLEKSNIASVDSIVRDAIGTNQSLRAELSSATALVVEDLDSVKDNILASIENSLKLDHKATENIKTKIDPSYGDLDGLKNNHQHKVVKIKDDTRNCLDTEYVVDEPSCSTPKKRPYNLPSITSIEGLRTQAFDELLKLFREDEPSSKQRNGDAKRLSLTDENVQSLRDSRPPLTTIN
ncbi:hypothetical protein Scep_015725 [Stephania cephalantha]|uniref:Kinesin-like protein n=1 Tax=Stephania cephalantha TaxID=152367 RepID=A0AAP0P1R0_9MAGN